MWLPMAAAGFFGLIALISLMRAEKSVANGALTIITLLAVGIAVAAAMRGYGPTGRTTQGETRMVSSAGPSFPPLSRVGGLARDPGFAACGKVLFCSAEATAPAVSHAAAQITR